MEPFQRFTGFFTGYGPIFSLRTNPESTPPHSSRRIKHLRCNYLQPRSPNGVFQTNRFCIGFCTGYGPIFSLRTNPDSIPHIAVVANCVPNFHKYYVEHLGPLHKHDPSLERNFPSSIFVVTTYNLGPRRCVSNIPILLTFPSVGVP